MEPLDVAEVVEGHGQLVVGEGGELMVGLPDNSAADRLNEDLAKHSAAQVLLAP